MSADIVGFPDFVETVGTPDRCESQADDWGIAVATLEGLLSNSTDGYVSNKALRRSLEELGVPNAADLCIRLKLYDHDTEGDNSQKCPSMRWHYKGRSFLTEDAFKDAEVQVDSAAEAASEAAATSVDRNAETDGSIDNPPKRKNRQEEARLVTYVKDALETLYDSEWLSDDSIEISFDVHSERAGSEFENVDVIAVNWRSEEVVELVAVEVKLDFSAGAVGGIPRHGESSLAAPVPSRLGDAQSPTPEPPPPRRIQRWLAAA